MKKLLLIVGLCVASTPLVAVVTQSPPDLSGEDLKMLEEIGKEVERYVQALPTEAQLRAQGISEDEIKKRETKEKFDAEVERYSKMSEKQLLEEMEKVFAEAASQAPAQPEPEIPQPAYRPPVIETEAKAEPKQIIPSDKQLMALKLIDTILISINNFLNKAQIMVELPGKIQAWVKEGKLKTWPAGLSWTTFRSQIEELVVKLNKIKDRDPRTGAFKYIDEFVKDESLVNNLAKIRESLTRNEPKIELSSFGIDKMSTESRTAVRSVLLSLYEATSLLGISQALDKIIEKYEPTAKKIKESEEAAQKRAIEESRRARVPGATTYSAVPPRERTETYGKGRDGERYAPSAYDAPRRDDGSSSDSKKALEAKSAGGGTAGDKKAEAAKAEDKAKREPEKKSEQYEGEFLSGLEAFTNAIHENAHFEQIEKHVKSPQPVDDDLTGQLISTATEGIRKATNAARKMKIQMSKLTEAQKKDYKKSFKDGFKADKKDIDSMYGQLNNLSKASQVIAPITNKQHIDAIHAKYHAYFGKEFQDTFDKQLEAKDKDLETLKDKLEDNKRIIDDAKKKAAATVPPSALPQNIIQMETQTVKMRAEIKKLEKEIKEIEAMLAKSSKTSLHDLRTRIQELRKAVDELN